MNAYCVKCENNAENIDPEISSTSNGKAMILSNRAISVKSSVKSIHISFSSKFVSSKSYV